MLRNEKQIFYKTLHGIKVPNGYAGNISRCVNIEKANLVGLKSHDCHILTQQLLPVALRGLLPKDVVAVLSDLCGYFRDICSKNIRVSDLNQHEAQIPIIMCHLEMIFPPSFFTVMAHLVIHLATQTKLAGPVMFRWMYFIEMYLGLLKSHGTCFRLKRRSRPKRLSLNDIERIQHETFHEWFRQHVDKLEQTNDINSLKEEVRMLARGPVDVITKYQGFNVNGFTFIAKRFDKCTQNSGVVVIAKTSSYASSSDRNPILGDVAYYGRLIDIIELKYLGGYQWFLFKCEWCDATSGRGVKKDESNYTLVNLSRLTNTGERLEDEPYIFASQAKQVYYIEDHSAPDWFVAMRMKPKGVCDLDDDEMMED
uniref:Transposase n=1 Tax=Chenopodium quinoa TaxID=63459 RepID=A0A803MX60_CHEQI